MSYTRPCISPLRIFILLESAAFLFTSSCPHRVWALWWQGGKKRLWMSQCPCRGRLGTLKNPSCPWRGCPAAGQNLETGHLPRHFIAEISLNVTLKPQTNKQTNKNIFVREHSSQVTRFQGEHACIAECFRNRCLHLFLFYFLLIVHFMADSQCAQRRWDIPRKKRRGHTWLDDKSHVTWE